MKSKTLNLIKSLTPILILAAVLAVSLVGTVMAYKTPPYTERKVYRTFIDAVCTYTYTAGVKPSLTYHNKTYIGVREPMYFRLVKDINVSLKCLISSPVEEIRSVDGSYTVTLALNSSAGWIHYIKVSEGAISNPTVVIHIPINMTKMLKTISTIDKEIGVKGSRVLLSIVPRIVVDVRTNNEVKKVLLVPTLDMVLVYDKGSVDIQGLRYSRTFRDVITIRRSNNISILGLPPVPVPLARNMTTIAAILSSAGLVLALTKPWRKHELTHEKIASKYGDMLVESRLSKVESPTAIVDLNNVKDLISLADSLRRPVLHSTVSKPGGITVHRYYVTDGSVIYRYTLISGTSEESKGRNDGEDVIEGGL